MVDIGGGQAAQHACDHVHQDFGVGRINGIGGKKVWLQKHLQRLRAEAFAAQQAFERCGDGQTGNAAILQ